MKDFSLKHLSDERLRRELSAAATNEKRATAELVAHIAEFDARKLYLPAAYASMAAYCVGELGLSEDAAKKRIQVARAAQCFPGMLEALAEGRIHLTGLRLLVPHLTPESVDELLAAAAHKSMDEIERLLAERHPIVGLIPRVEALPGIPQELAVGVCASGQPAGPQVVANAEREGAARHPQAHSRFTPLSGEAFAVQFTRSREADERFRYLQDLLGHQVSRSDIAGVYDRAVRALIEKMERVRFGACDRPRAAARKQAADPRYVPPQVKREVWKRDGGQCTFMSESGRRCEACGDVEFDHVQEHARGGEATVANIQLRCRGHNQYTAERKFGAGFMQRKRAEAKAAAARRKAEKAAAAEAARLQPHELEVIPWLRELGCREGDCRQAARLCRDMADATIEDRVRRALSWFGARCGRKISPAPAA